MADPREMGLGIGKLRTTARDADARIAEALAFAAPEAGRMTGDGQLSCLRLAPHEWLVVGSAAAVREALARLTDALAGELALILDMTHAGEIVMLSVPHAVERIAAYCELDLRPAAFPTGSATRTRFGDIAVTLARMDDQSSFCLIADQSHADYLRRLLDHAAPAAT